MLYVLAHLNQIIYLDYRLVDPNMRAEGLKKFEIDIGQLLSQEETEENQRNEANLVAKEIQQNKEAYVDGLESDELFLNLFAEDTEGQKLNETPGAAELLNDYHDKFVNVCKEMFAFGKEQKDTRMTEVKEFWKCLLEAKELNTLEATKQINIFTEWKKNVFDFIIKFNCYKPCII